MASFEYILFPLLECLVLVGIHSYLGIHVIRRKVIFVDLSLAQLAALGATVGFFFGIMPETPAAFIFSIVFTAAGAAVFSVTRMRSERIPHEAVIGLVYAVAAALSIIVIDKSPSGAEHIKNVLVGRIEWVRGHEVAIAAGAYAVVGLVHWIFRKQFYTISERPGEAYASGMKVRAWDFLFYLTFGVVISISVKVAGVLLVFVFLVVPAIAAVLITDNHLKQLLIGWGMGTAVSVVGMFVSYHASLPSGPTVVAVYALALIVTAVVLMLVRSGRRAALAARVVVGTVIVLAFVGLIALLGFGLKDTSLGRTEHHHEELEHHHEDAPSDHHDPEAPPDEARDGAAAAPAVPEDPELVVEWAAERIEGERRREAISALLELMSDDEVGFFYRQQAIDLVEESAGREFGYDPEAGAEDNAPALERIREWMETPGT
jgi:zinc/manganese transport system permease protein